MQPIMNKTAPRPRPVGSLFTPINIDDEVTIEQVTQAVEGLDKSCLQDMLALTYVLKNDRGSSSPAEELISNLLQTYGCFGGCVTPKDVEEEAEAFRHNWEGARGDAEGMAQRYPHLFSAVVSDGAAGAADAGADGREAETAESTATKGDEPEHQAAALSTGEHDSLKHRILAKLCEPVSDGQIAAADTETSSDQQPESATLHLALELFDECISRIKSKQSDLPASYEQYPAEFNGLLADALILREILMDWTSQCHSERFPQENDIVAAIRGNLGL